MYCKPYHKQDRKADDKTCQPNFVHSLVNSIFTAYPQGGGGEMKRGNGEGTVYFDRTKNRWIAKVTVGYDKDGRAVRRSRTAKTKEEAVKKKTELLKTHWTAAALDADKLTVAEYLTLWLDTYKVGQVRETTLVQYRTQASKIAAQVGGLRLAALSPLHVRAIAKDKGRNTLKLLKGALRQAVIDGLLEKNPADGVRAPKANCRVCAARLEDVLRVIEAARQEKPALSLILSIALYTGMRAGEICALRWSDIDGTRCTVRRTTVRFGGHTQVSPPKTRRSLRTIELPESLVAEIKSYRMQMVKDALKDGAPVPDALFQCRTGNFHTSATIGAALRYFCMKLGVPVIRMHQIRHLHAPMLFAAGRHPKDIQERLGHASVAITMDTYTEYIPSRDKDIADYLEALYRNQRETNTGKA